MEQKSVQDIYIEMENRGGCCSGPVFVPVIKLGKPEDSDLHEKFVKEDIIVHVPKKIINDENKNAIIKLRNILGHKSLVVSGVLAYKEKTWEKKKY